MKACVMRVVLAVVLVAMPASAGEFHAIIMNFGSAPRAGAHMDVSFDSLALGGNPVDVLFEVFTADGSRIAEFTVPANPNGFASSASAPLPNRNLFRVSGGEPALVRARIPAGAVGGTATLHQRGQGSRLLVTVPADRKSDGTAVHAGKEFNWHVGDIRGTATATVLVANVSGADVAADIYVGTAGGTGAGKYTTARIMANAVWRVDLQPDDENSNLVLVSNGDVIVQLAIDDGRMNGLTVLPTAN